jgi:ATP-dependent DNA ligase
MLAKLVRELPEGPEFSFEPKWDGFRSIVFRDGPEIELASRNERPLTRYFPELLTPLLEQLPPRIVLDGEIVIAGPDGLDFDALLQRIHPAKSRIQMLASTTPAAFVAFDVLAEGDRSLLSTPFGERRRILEQLLSGCAPPLYLTPATRDRSLAADWFQRFEGAGLDGVIAKSLDLPYLPGKREMYKVKHARTADCVVGGFRAHATGGVGSLLLGLFDDAGVLHHVGVATGFTAKARRDLESELAPLQEGALDGHPWANWRNEEAHDGKRMPGGASRWAGKRDTSWQPLRPTLVAEVAYDHLQGERFRHATRFVRFRLDREPSSCTYAQLEVAPPAELAQVFGA